MSKFKFFTKFFLLAATMAPSGLVSAQTTDVILPQNPGFEDGVGAWTIREKVPMSSISAEAARNGKYGLRVVDSDNNGSSALSGRLAVKAGDGYQLSFWAKADTEGAAGVFLWLYGTDGQLVQDYQPAAVVRRNESWAEYKIVTRIPQGVDAAAIWIHSFSAPKVTMDVDDFAFTALPAEESAKLPLPAIAKDPTTAKPRTKPPYIILKLDDLVGNRNGVSERWKKVGDLLRQRNIKGSIGIICNSLEADAPAYFQWIKDLHGVGLVEFWNHGYTHKEWEENGRKMYEFSGPSYEQQKYSFARSAELAKEKLGIPLNTFGPGYGYTDANTARALSEMADIKVWLYGETNNPAGKVILDRIGAVNIENPLFVPSVERFVQGYNRYPDREFFVIQGHPAQWDEARFEQFVKIIDFLQEQKAVFVTPMEYVRVQRQK